VSVRPRPRQLSSNVDPWDRNADLTGNVAQAIVATPAASVHESRIPVVAVVDLVAVPPVRMVVRLGPPVYQIVVLAVRMVVRLGPPAFQIVAVVAVAVVAVLPPPVSMVVRLRPSAGQIVAVVPVSMVVRLRPSAGQIVAVVVVAVVDSLVVHLSPCVPRCM
jgi:hypothetical protein